jgi:hypothetical protein
MSIKAVVIPIDDVFLLTLVDRGNDLTTLIWGWQGNSNRMVTPQRILRQQDYIPFLFSSTNQTYKTVTHMGVSGLIVHREDVSAEFEARLNSIRVELGSRTEFGTAVRSLYVVTATHELDPHMPYEDFVLVSDSRPLLPTKVRGYAIVHLPSSLMTNYTAACDQWDALQARIPKAPSR